MWLSLPRYLKNINVDKYLYMQMSLRNGMMAEFGWDLKLIFKTKLVSFWTSCWVLGTVIVGFENEIKPL